MTERPYLMTILSLDEDGGVTAGFRKRRCHQVLLGDEGVLRCERTPKHAGRHAAVVTIDGQRRVIVADVVIE